jgi:hypothetical protein
LAIPTIVQFGNFTQFATPTIPVGTELMNSFVCPRAGLLQNLTVNFAAFALPANIGIQVILRKSAACLTPFVDALTLTTPAGIEAPPPLCLFSGVSVPVAQNDAINLTFRLVSLGGSLIGASTSVQVSAGMVYG